MVLSCMHSWGVHVAERAAELIDNSPAAAADADQATTHLCAKLSDSRKCQSSQQPID